MSELTQVYTGAENLFDHLRVTQDGRTGFYLNEAGHPIAFHRTQYPSDAPMSYSEEGSLGSGIYLGNTEQVVASFSKIPYMRALVVVELPCRTDEIQVVDAPAQFDREAFDRMRKTQEVPARMLSWKPPVGNTLGCLVMGGFRMRPKTPRWGLWVDETTEIRPFAKIVSVKDKKK